MIVVLVEIQNTSPVNPHFSKSVMKCNLVEKG